MNSAPTELKIKSIAGSINISRLTALQRRQLLFAHAGKDAREPPTGCRPSYVSFFL